MRISKFGVYRLFGGQAIGELRYGNQTLSGMVAYTARNLGFTAGDQTELVHGEIVGANYFSVLGVQPAIADRLLLALAAGVQPTLRRQRL